MPVKIVKLSYKLECRDCRFKKTFRNRKAALRLAQDAKDIHEFENDSKGHQVVIDPQFPGVR